MTVQVAHQQLTPHHQLLAQGSRSEVYIKYLVLYIKNQVLYVHLTSAALRQELMMGRELLVRNLNRHVGAQVITNIIFR